MTDAGRRIFIAVPLDHALRDAIADLERRLESSGVRLRWIRPENLHLTLRFLGQISPAQLSRARRAVQEAVAGTSVFRIRLGGVGAFPSPQRPKVVWIGVTDGAAKLSDLAGRLDDALARQRFAKEPRAFQPHLTLARTRIPGQMPPLEAAIASLQAAEVGEQGVSSLIIMESLLRPSGALYIPVEEVPLPTHEK